MSVCMNVCIHVYECVCIQEFFGAIIIMSFITSIVNSEMVPSQVCVCVCFLINMRVCLDLAAIPAYEEGMHYVYVQTLYYIWSI